MISRRLFLRRAATAAPLIAAPSIALAAAQPEENPALLALEPGLDAAEAEVVAAVAAYEEALRIGWDLWPRAPEEITYKRSSWEFAMERDITGQGFENAPGLRSSGLYRDRIAETKRWRKMTPEREERRRHLLNGLQLAEQYEAACEKARQVSCYPAANERQNAAVDALKVCIKAIHDQPAHSMAGVRIKAKALQAWGHAPAWCRLVNLDDRGEWGPGLAKAVLETMGMS